MLAPPRLFVRIKGAFLVAIVVALSACAPTFDVSKLEALPEVRPLTRLSVAHRGSLHEGLPDNSIVALKEAAQKGVQLLEVDVRLGSDGQLFLFHDGSLREENYSSPEDLFGRSVQGLSGEERARVRLDPEGKIPVPLLADALQELRSSRTTLQLDLKGESDELVRAVVAEIAKASAFERVVVQIRSSARFARLRRSTPKARILARCKDGQQLADAIAAGVEFAELERWITAAGVARAHEANIPVLINVAGSQYDEPKVWRLLRSRGVDLIMTNHALAAR